MEGRDELRISHLLNEAYLSKPWRDSIGMLQLFKVVPILRELPQGKKNHFIYYGERERTEEALHILWKKKESRGKPVTRYAGIRRNEKFDVRDQKWRGPLSISQQKKGSRA